VWEESDPLNDSPTPAEPAGSLQDGDPAFGAMATGGPATGDPAFGAMTTNEQPFSGQGAYPAWPQPMPPTPQVWTGPSSTPQHWGPAQFTYSVPQSDWGPPAPPPPARKPRNRKRTLMGWGITLSILIVVSLAASLGVHIHRLGWEHSDYGYDIVERMSVEAAAPWVVNLPLVLTADSSSAIQIYSDPELTYPVPFADSADGLTLTGRKRTFTPSLSRVQPSDNLSPSAPAFMLGGDSWPAGTYYIVERQGLFGGSLERPRVHVYSVSTGSGPADSFLSPDFTMEVADGVPTFSWTGVDGASAYYILKSTPVPTAASTLEVIGWTDAGALSWAAATQDMAYENTRQNTWDVTSYNTDFQAGACTPQDTEYQGMTPPEWDDSALVYPSFAVVAADGSRSTLPEMRNGRDLILDTPVAAATATLNQMETDAGTELFIPDGFPVTMGDCRTVFFPVAAQQLVATSDETSITLTYGVTGTRLTHSLTGTGDSYSQVQNLGSQRGLRTLVQVGPMQDLSFMSSDQVRIFALNQTPSAEQPDSPYTWNGTSDMVKFIAANMYAGTPAIDLSRFTADPNAPLIGDAANEAYLQNPYITDFLPIIGIKDDVLYVNYEITPEERAAAAARIKAKVDQVLASIVTGSMTERGKALAINKYLAQNAVYDNAAATFNDGGHSRDEYITTYPNSWDAEGVLLDGKGVCSSYASAFKALADGAGLDSVTVTGWADTSGIGHEWVKVRINGSWWVIDPTWNSNIWEQVRGNVQTFFMLTDAQADRTPFNGFVVDSHISDYDTA